MLNVEKITYLDYFKKVKNFISLDISVHSSGWVRKIEDKLSYGTFSIQSNDELGRRKEFRSFIMKLFEDTTYDIVFIEDVIAGNNFKTTKGLIQLNTIVDDLNDLGLIHVNQIKRIDNKSWKKYLKESCNYIGNIKCENDKELIVNCLNILGFNEDVKQDIYDAMGIAVSVIFRYLILGEKKKLGTILKNDLRKNYTIKQFMEKDKKYEHQLSRYITKYNRKVEEIDWLNENSDILKLF